MRQPPHWTLIVVAVLTLLMAMLGCQGVSARSDSNPPPPPAAQLTASSTSLAFGTVAVGTIQVLPETVTNSGTASLTLNTVSVTGTGFTISGLSLPMALAAGQSTSFNVVFQPPSVMTGATGNVALANTGTNSVLNIPLSGSGATPADVTASPVGYSFGTVAMGSTVTENETLTNADVNNATISQATVIGAGFGVINLNLPLTLTPGQTTTFGVTFSPAALSSTDGAVVLTVNGVSNAVVLGYSGAGGSTAVPAVVTPSPGSLTFSNIATGQTSSQTVTLTNTGGVSTTVSQATASGTGFSVSGFTAGTLVPGATMSFSVTFAPTTVGSFPGTVTVTSNASNPSLSIPITGTAVAPPAVLTASPTSLTYTNIIVGQSSSQTETIKNTGGTNAVISAVTETGAGFSVSGITPPVTLTPGQSTTFTVKFAPTSATTFSGTVTVTSNASNPSLSIALSGAAEGAPAVLTASPTSLTYTNITVGQSSSQTETIKNTGGTSATISAVAATGTGFSISGITPPVTLTPGQSTTFTVKFAPTSAGTFPGTLTVTSNASNPSLAITLSGTAVTAATLTASPTSLTYTNVTVGQTSSQTETIKNTGGTSATISAVGESGAGFIISGITPPVTLTAGQSTTFTVKFAPTSAGTFPGTVTVTSNASNPSLDISLSGTAVTPATLTASPTSLTYTNITVGQTSSQTETIQNTGGTSATISAVGESGAGFTVSGITPPVTLTAGQSTTFTVKFAPTSAGTFPGTVTVTSNASNPSLSIPLSGTAVTATGGTLTAVPTTVAVPGNVAVGTSGTATGQLTAATASVTVSGVNVVGSEFVISGLAFPVTIPAGSSATYTVTFSPTSSGSASTTASFVSNASNAPTGVSLTGTAVAAPVYTVGLSWTASGSTGVTGYYIYRALYNTSTSTCGSYTKLNPSTPNATTSYTDSNSITDGDTYCYQVTAFDATTGQESTDSNMATAIIPAP